ncbi:MAG: cytochrome c oxidase accessory protein CcoG [Pseudomonadota bacterium]
MSVSNETDPPALYAARKEVFPKAVSGPFRRLKWALMAVMLAIYYVTPWVRWDRGAHLPDQAVLVDLANRRFFFFWIEIWPQEFYYVAGLLIMAGIGLFLFTSVLGRVWCGYACPQTVWVDLYQHVERWIDGDRNNQFRLLKRKWDADKLMRRALKWSIFLLIALATGGAWVFYFADAPTLLSDLISGQAPLVAYSTVAILTATTFVLGGFMREQVCIYMCPWPRIQAAMLDENSLTVTYKDWRGEPRGKHRKSAAAANLGDCIDCNACVAVCPTGVDIRNGQQIGCITCALCIDACDDIMAKIGKPRGLIDYCSLADEKLERAGNTPVPVLKRIIRPRTILYTALWAAIGVAMVVSLFLRDTIDLTVRQSRNPVFVVMSDGSIRNSYEVNIQNRNPEPNPFRLSATVPDGVHLRLTAQDTDPTAVLIPADSARKLRVFLTSAGERLTGRIPVTLWIENLFTRERSPYTTHFQGPDE